MKTGRWALVGCALVCLAGGGWVTGADEKAATTASRTLRPASPSLNVEPQGVPLGVKQIAHRKEGTPWGGKVDILQIEVTNLSNHQVTGWTIAYSQVYQDGQTARGATTQDWYSDETRWLAPGKSEQLELHPSQVDRKDAVSFRFWPLAAVFADGTAVGESGAIAAIAERRLVTKQGWEQFLNVLETSQRDAGGNALEALRLARSRMAVLPSPRVTGMAPKEAVQLIDQELRNVEGKYLSHEEALQKLIRRAQDEVVRRRAHLESVGTAPQKAGGQ